MAELFTTYYHSPVGIMEIKGTSTHVASILYVEEVGEATTTIPAVLQMGVEQLSEYFAGARQVFTLPFAQTGTDFQQRVWHTLTSIQYGETVSYMNIAVKLGDAKSIRAVGNANGKNKLNIVVPCHRVIGSNGNLVGYGGGLWRKQWLLEHEAKIAKGILSLF
ncbi:MAG: methylated-DNA--[protein]-cysteine S-methyltransferase [Caldilineaceae bacterium]